MTNPRGEILPPPGPRLGVNLKLRPDRVNNSTY